MIPHKRLLLHLLQSPYLVPHLRSLKMIIIKKQPGLLTFMKNNNGENRMRRGLNCNNGITIHNSAI